MNFFRGKMRQEHVYVLVLAFMVALIYGSHHFFITQNLKEVGSTYHPVTLDANYDEAATYGIRVQGVLIGDLIPGDIALKEYENSPSLLPILNPLLLGVFAFIFGSTEYAIIFGDFLFPALIFLLLYLFFFELSGRRCLSLLGALLFIFAPKLALYIPPTSLGTTVELAKGLVPFLSGGQELYFSRFEYPQVTYLFYLLTFYFSLRALKRKERFALIVAGVSFGILFYTYFYDWAYALVAFSIIFAIFLAKRDFFRARYIAYMLSIGFAVSIFYWINFFSLTSLPHYADIAARVGLELSNSFRFETWQTYVRSLALIFALWFVWYKRDGISVVYLSGFLGAMFVVLNVQVLTGFNPQPDHWHREQFLPIFSTFLILALWLKDSFLQKTPDSFWKYISLFLIIFILFANIIAQYRFSEREAERYTINEGYSKSYVWLNKMLPKGSVISSISPETNTEIGFFTHHKIFLPNGINTLASHDEIWERFLLINRFYEIELETFSEFIDYNNFFLVYLFHDQYRRDHSLGSYFRENPGHKLPSRIYADKINLYNEILNTRLEGVNIPFEIDYIYQGPREEALGKIKNMDMSLFEEVYNRSGVKIYKVNK